MRALGLRVALLGLVPCWPGPPGSDPALCPPDDPRFARHWEYRGDIPEGIDRSKMHPSELALGSIGFSLDRAWQWTTGRDEVVIAVLDSGIRWNERDLVRKLYLNPGELPLPRGASVHDANGDGVFDVLDYAGDDRVTDANGNGLLDPADLIRAFSDCRDDDRDGYPDDISGFDFFGDPRCGFAAGDNDPGDDTDFGHGTGIASTAAAQTNNALDDAGVCPRCRILPVRVGDSFVVDANRFARGVVFAVHAGASVIASALGSYNNTPAAAFAVDLAYERGIPLIASAADEYSYHHNYPSVYNHTLYVNAVRYDHPDDYRKASTFWGVNPCTNFGARVWITVPATTCSSGATSRLSGVAGLMQSMALEAGLGPLHAEEVYQTLRTTADDLDSTAPDWGGSFYTARPGFDQLYGYGRLNAARAVLAVREGALPPIVDLVEPRWFEIVSPVRRPVVAVTGSIRLPRASRATYRLAYALGVEPTEREFHEVSSGPVVGRLEGLLGQLDLGVLPLPAGPAPRNREERDRFSVTVRLRVTDDRGRIGEARRSFFVFHDPTWKDSFPVDLGASGEAGPLLVDLDRDGRDEIVLPTADGYVRIYRAEASGLRLTLAPLDLAPPVDPAEKRPHPFRETVIRGAVAGDLFGNGTLALVVASRDGGVYAFSARGERLGGFPVHLPRRLAQPASPQLRVESGVLSSPVLTDLDGKPGLEILVSGLDGYLHAWRNDGRVLEGFPVAIENPAQPGQRDKLVSRPSVGDIDGDGRPEIVVGSNGQREGLAAVYAIRTQGRRHPAGPLLPGWPVEIPALRGGLLPTLATGVQMSPLLVDVDGDGDLEVLVYAVTGGAIVQIDQRQGGKPEIVARYEMTPGPGSELEDLTFLAGTGSALLADSDHDGRAELYAPLLPFRMLTLRARPGVPLDVPLALGGWDLGGSAGMRHGYPRRMEDLMVFAGPAAADLDGDGADEVLMGSGGYLLHAFREAGGEPPGFPKFTGGWIFSAPAVGDIDGDARPDIVAVTREGYLFAWSPSNPMTR